MRCCAFCFHHMVVWCLETFFGECGPNWGSSKTYTHSQAKSGNNRFEAKQRGFWPSVWCNTAFPDLKSFFSFFLCFTQVSNHVLSPLSGGMWKLHPSDWAMEPDPSVRVWNRGVQPHLHLCGPRTQVTGKQRCSHGDILTLAPLRTQSAAQSQLPSFSASYLSSICAVSRSGRLKKAHRQRLCITINTAKLLLVRYLTATNLPIPL